MPEQRFVTLSGDKRHTNRDCKKEELTVSAKRKLNSAHLLGSAFVAGLLGLVTNSVTVFLVALAVLLVAAYLAGDLRR